MFVIRPRKIALSRSSLITGRNWRLESETSRLFLFEFISDRYSIQLEDIVVARAITKAFSICGSCRLFIDI